MTPLRRRMLEDLELRGYAAGTVLEYVRVVAQLARYYGQSPDELTEEQVRQYLVYLVQTREVSRNTYRVALYGIKFFYEQTLDRPLDVLTVARPRREKKLPRVLSRAEVWQVLDAVRNDAYRACLTAIYACGLRLGEGVQLQVSHVDSGRGVLRVHGKNGKERQVPLANATLALLRGHWCTHRSPRWLFVAQSRANRVNGLVAEDRPIVCATVRHAFARAVTASGLRKVPCVHTLRHSYATHLLEDGVPLPVIQAYLGHASPRTTAVYLHLTREIREATRRPVERLMQRP